MINTGYAKINSDEWQDSGATYKVLELNRYEDTRMSTRVELLIQHEGGQKERRVVPLHWIEWIKDGDK